MGAPALGGVNHQGAAQTQLLPKQVVMHCPHSQEGRHHHAGGGQLGSGTGAIHTIGEHQYLGTAAHSLLGRLTQPLQGRRQATSAGLNGHLGGEGGNGKSLLADRRKLGFVENRRVQVNHGGRLGLGLQRRPAFTPDAFPGSSPAFPSGGQSAGW